jgi:hypothetical protein
MEPLVCFCPDLPWAMDDKRLYAATVLFQAGIPVLHDLLDVSSDDAFVVEHASVF